MMATYARYRLAIFLGTTIASVALLGLACSSGDRPASSSSTTSFDGSVSGEGSTIADAGRDRDVADASDDRFSPDDGHCLDNRPAPTIDGGFTGGDDAGVPICTTTGAACVTPCEDVVAHYKLGVAQVAVTCMRSLADCSDTLSVRLCVENALMQSCQDPTAPTACAPLVKPCEPDASASDLVIFENGCESFMRGLNPNGRQTLASCIQDKIDAGTCARDLTECTDQILQ